MTSEWTVSIDDSSPLIQYLPHGDGGVGDWTNTGWQPWYSGSGGFNSAGGNDGVGMSYHVTAFPGARFDLLFHGTGVSLFGNTSCTYTVSIDGASQFFPASEGTLYSKDGLSEGTHNVSVTADASASGQFWFDRADISRPLPAGASAPTSVVYQATNTSFLKYSGDWKVQNDPNGQIPSKDNPAPYQEVQDAPASVSFSFEGTGVAVNGSRNWGGLTYDVNVDGNVSTYNASTMWLIGDALLYYQEGLDPQITHTVNITPRVGGGLKFWLNSVTLLADSGGPVAGGTNSTTGSPVSDSTTTGKKTNVGVVVGPIIGGIAALLILAALALWYRRKRRAASGAFTRAQFSPYALQASPATQEAGASAPTTPRPSKLASEANSPYAGRQAARSPQMSTHPSTSSVVSSPPPQTAQTQPPGIPASSGASEVSSSAQPQSPASAAAVDRLIQIIADRIDRTHPPPPIRYDYGADVPPPEYGAL
ncbi:hypothetical protein TRAPUB_639 [Trametes pubescens]|uniref:Transmembrane protein n=1 Tax=Trametes pubescens TaxID=154538 RepID=A0A1M2VLL4_TRAPU|nr:hypothetical protein TRAPUB_639 [Trametes pubescens]